MTGRGRGESKKVHIIDEVDERIEIDRQAQLEAARIIGIPESDIPIRGRGGFRQVELRTIPENVTQTRSVQTGARQVELLTNFVQLIPMQSRALHMYRVDFEPVVESASTMRFLFRAAGGALFRKMPVYGGVHECRSGEELPETVTTFTVADGRAENREYVVKITHTGAAPYGQEMLRIYNMHMNEFLRTMGFYSPQPGVYVHQQHYTPVGPNLMMLRGYRTSANLHDGNKMLMNLEAAHKIVQTKNVLQLMSDARVLAQQRGANLQETLREELIGKIVVTSYNKRVYRVEDVNFELRPSSTFDRSGEQMTYLHYYQQVLNLNVTDQRQPMLRVVPNNQRRRDEVAREIYLMPEFCNIAGLTVQQRTDGRLRFELIRASQVSPADRVKHLREFLRGFHQNAEIRAQLASWGYNYGTDALRIQASVAPMTGFATGEKTREPLHAWPRANLNTADIMINELAVTPEIKKIAVVTTRIDLRDKMRILSTLKGGFDKVGLRVTNPVQVDVQEGDLAKHYVEAIRRMAPDTQIAIIIMHAQNKERYDAIKKAASVERGLITQCVTAKLMTDEKKARSAAQKIAIQIAAKVGGEPWWCDIPMKKTMICGYDTYHDTAQRGRSFGAFVASLNVHFSRWWSKADAHDRLDEISAQVSTNITEAINHYKKFNNNELPERVIIYRDGVGEGQLEHVYRVEVKKIKEALVAISATIRLTIIVVNKRIGARFYMRSNDTFVNPPPGLVVDHSVTRQERYDFYLISQSTRQGTVSPTYYNIIHDEAAFTPDIHQKMAFKMCLLYYNWSGTVRVPAPCQYAHKLALLCGEHLHAQPNTNMDDKLHFL